MRAPCVADCLPDFITLVLPRREIGVALEINGSRFPTSESAKLSLRLDRVDKEASEVTYVSTDSVRVTGSVEFEVYEGDGDVMIVCGALDRLDMRWTGEAKSSWSLECYAAVLVGDVERERFAFLKPKKGISSPSFEVYIAGCCGGLPVILTKMVQVSSPRRKVGRQSLLDAIPEEDEKETSDGFSKLHYQVEIKQKIHVDGELNRARCMPQNPLIVAAKTSGVEVYVFDCSKHPEKDDSCNPDLRLFVGCVGFFREWCSSAFTCL